MNLKITNRPAANGIEVEASIVTGGIHFLTSLKCKPPHEYAAIDGMLYSLIQRILEHYRSGHLKDTNAARVAKGLQLYMEQPGYFTGTDEDGRRITRTIANRMAELAPLAGEDRLRIQMHEDLVQLANLLKDRILNNGKALHGIAHLVTAEAA